MCSSRASSRWHGGAVILCVTSCRRLHVPVGASELSRGSPRTASPVHEGRCRQPPRESLLAPTLSVDCHERAAMERVPRCHQYIAAARWRPKRCLWHDANARPIPVEPAISSMTGIPARLLRVYAHVDVGNSASATVIISPESVTNYLASWFAAIVMSSGKCHEPSAATEKRMELCSQRLDVVDSRR